MDIRAQPTSWYDTMMTYSLLSSAYPTVVRYISGAFIALGFVFIIPIILLIAVDFGIYIYRICWSRPWNRYQNQPSHPHEQRLQQLQLHKLPPEVVEGTPIVTSTATGAVRKRIQHLSKSGDGNDVSSG
ncbi:uncharacterized protein LY79DRAFT_554162 [Colletotrichum navitas]|uniref:Uncharacterized protein n=1 Tax=Colletotrichum navitas TaxID=681940 RepID=A0AAD8PZ08_9PEZI|nr:uncharacterized protein LY79DRAFT_554162 [Colletotrichum navitas]KAK1590546.1 hypothetical protein LY79DRAFT_554162 [Colletotrichum navitas]